MPNQLLDVSRLAEMQAGIESTQENAMKDEKEVQRRCYLYNDEHPEGVIFEGDEAIDAAVKGGWNDVPPHFCGDKSVAQIQLERADELAEELEKLRAENDELKKANTAAGDNQKPAAEKPPAKAAAVKAGAGK